MANPAKPARPSLIETIEQLKQYTEFESVTVGADGSVSVKYAARHAASEKKEKAPPVRKTAIDSLGETHPPFLAK